MIELQEPVEDLRVMIDRVKTSFSLLQAAAKDHNDDDGSRPDGRDFPIRRFPLEADLYLLSDYLTRLRIECAAVAESRPSLPTATSSIVVSTISPIESTAPIESTDSIESFPGRYYQYKLLTDRNWQSSVPVTGK